MSSVPLVEMTTAYAARLRPLDQLRQVGAQQRLAAAEQDDRRAERRQVVDDRLRLLRRQLALVLAVERVGVAVGAVEVAAARDVPGDHRLLVLRVVQQMRRQLAGQPAEAQGVAGRDRAAEKPSYSKHTIPLRIVESDDTLSPYYYDMEIAAKYTARRHGEARR